jgi:enoyl-[acyl-carrier protein] reductase III
MNGNESALRLDGKVALITGGTRGLGLAVARKLCVSGSHVFLNYGHDDEAAEAAVKELSGLGGSATVLRADITDPQAVPGMVARVLEHHSRLDVFVHNAATYHPMPTLQAVPADVHADITAALDPLLHGINAVADAMAGGPGRIVAVSSNGSRGVVPQYVSLGIAKAALESMIRYLAVELAGRGIAVNAVSTGKLDKGAGTPGGAKMTAMLASRTPAGRLSRPEDVADAVALLCTDEAAWIHGQVVTADGGLGLHA